MKQPILAAAALLAALFLSGNASALTGGEIKSLQIMGHSIMTKAGCCHRQGCGPCGGYRAYRYTVYPSCGRYDLYNYTTITGCGGYGYTNYRCGCGCGHCTCGYGYGGCGHTSGWRIFGWLY